ncbi:MAG: class I SAM-dependent methyltransferase, partial [Chloroflexota bacterium]
ADIEQKEILEIGCGDGRITKLLAESSDSVYAIDPDSERVRLAQQAAPNASVAVGSGEDLHFEANRFDLVIFTLSLHHHSDRLRALNEAARVVKPNGKILVIEPVADGELERVFAFINDEEAVLAETQAIISGSRFAVVRDMTFTANWIFDDAQEVCTILFDQYDLDFDHKIASKVYDFMGDKVDQKPVILVDKLRAQVIQKS